jgi:uncharacterized protein (TIGR00251 family)
VTSAGATISVRVQPRAQRDEIVAVRDGVLVVRVVAPPVEGRANDAVRRVVSERLGVPPSRVRLLRGQRSRDKVLRVEGLDQAAADHALGL